MISMNGDITQELTKLSMGIAPARSTAGKNYAYSVNMKAKDRLARLKINLRIKDMVESISRIKWNSLPIGLRSKLIERVLYYRGQGMWFWDASLQRYYFLPYAMTSESGAAIDFYGQYQLVKPYSFNGKAEDNKKSGGKNASDVYLGTITRVPVYDMEELEAYISEHGEQWCKDNLCIIIRDYTQQMSETVIPRATTQEPYIEFQTEVLPILRTLMLKAAMPKLVKTSDQGVVDSLLAELQTIEDAIIEGKTMIPVTAFQDLQDIDGGDQSIKAIDEFLKVYQSLENIRKENLGIPNDGMFQKQAHMLQSEQEIKSSSSNVLLENAIQNREDAVEMINRLWGLSITINTAESIDSEEMEEENIQIEDETEYMEGSEDDN